MGVEVDTVTGSIFSWWVVGIDSVCQGGLLIIDEIPRYLTNGDPWIFLRFKAYISVCLAAGTLANQYHGETPICSEMS